MTNNITVKLRNPGQVTESTTFPSGRDTVVCIEYMVFWVKCFYRNLGGNWETHLGNHIRERSGRQLGHNWETSDKQLEDNWETIGRRLEDNWK